MRRGISAIIASRNQGQYQSSPFSVLKQMQWTNLDPVFPDSRKFYTHEISAEVSNYMKENNIAYARLTTASVEKTAVRHIVLLPELKKVAPQLQNVGKKHPDISQTLPRGCYIINPRVLTCLN